MKVELRVAKLKRYYEQLAMSRVTTLCELAPFTGVIHNDGEEHSATPFSLYRDSVLKGARQTFEITSSFCVPKDALRPMLYIDMGKSASADALTFLYGPEAVVYIDGKARMSLDVHHDLHPIPPDLADSNTHTVTLKGWTGIKDEFYTVARCEICTLNENVEQLCMFIEVTLDYFAGKPQSNTAHKLLSILNEALNKVDVFNIDETALSQCIETLKSEYIALGGKSAETFFACGHGHLDVAWLWTVQRSRSKALRTFLNALELMDTDNADFKFSQTQAVLYEIIKHDEPQVFERIKKAVGSGRWELVGKSYVEFDCNMIGEESLVRQFILGKQLFLDYFGQQGTNVCWLPDTFGFCAQLPQILNKVGIDRFATAKVTWNAYNKFPYDSFLWQGLDGSEVTSHVVSTSIPAWWGATYSADLTVKEIISTENDIRQKDSSVEMLISYGQGDGGGGPSRQMLLREKAFRNLPALPDVKLSTFDEFFNTLEMRKDELPRWVGEIYFELHRGTYTSQAGVKKGNRLCEQQLHNAEFVLTISHLLTNSEYRHEQLTELWKLVCLNQFHDILPGSSIKEVYEVTAAEHAKVIAATDGIIAEELERLSPLFASDEEQYIVVNTTPYPRSETVLLQQEYYRLNNIQPYSISTFSPGGTQFESEDDNLSIQSLDDGFVLKNSKISVSFNTKGEITSYIDCTCDRELIKSGCVGNDFRLFDDLPADWEAWDIDEYYKENPVKTDKKVLDSAIKVQNPHIVTLYIKTQMCNSIIEQEISLCAGEKHLTFVTGVCYNERKKLLKVSFPVNILSDVASYDVQFGVVKRPTHKNTSYEQAMFEVCAHRWADYSEGDYGVALLNNCKYGYDVHGDTVTLTLLKGACFPDETADLGEHEFSYALLPHTKQEEQDINIVADRLNYPLIVKKATATQTENDKTFLFYDRFFKAHGDALLLKNIKVSQDNDGIILRLCETKGSRGTLAFNSDAERIFTCNLLEEDECELQKQQGNYKLCYKPYEIITLRLKGVN